MRVGRADNVKQQIHNRICPWASISSSSSVLRGSSFGYEDEDEDENDFRYEAVR